MTCAAATLPAAAVAAALLGAGCGSSGGGASTTRTGAPTSVNLSARSTEPSIAVTESAALAAGSRSLVAIQMRNTGSAFVGALPVEVGSGSSARRVGTVPIVPPGASIWWVSRSLPKAASGDAGSVTVLRGRKMEVAPALEVVGLTLSPSAGGRLYAVGTLVNRSKAGAVGVTVTAVSTRGGRPIAAGRAALERVAPKGSQKIRVPLVGDPSGGVLTAVATAERGGNR